MTAQGFNHNFLSPPAFSTASSVLYLSVSTDPGFVQISWPKWLWLEQGQFYVSKCKARFGPCSSGIILMPREEAGCEAGLETGMTEVSLASSQNFPRCYCKGTEPVHRQVAEYRPWRAGSADVLCIWKTLCEEILEINSFQISKAMFVCPLCHCHILLIQIPKLQDFQGTRA